MPDTIMEHRLAVCCHDNQPTMYQLTVSDTENAFTWQRMNGAPKLQRMLVLLTANQSTAHNSWISAALWIQKCYFCFPMATMTTTTTMMMMTMIKCLLLNCFQWKNKVMHHLVSKSVKPWVNWKWIHPPPTFCSQVEYPRISGNTEQNLGRL